MNEKYQEIIEKCNADYPVNKEALSDDGKWAFNRFFIAGMKAGINDYEFCDYQEIDEYILKNRMDAWKAALLWSIYYAVDKLGCNCINRNLYWFDDEKLINLIGHIALPWIKAYCGNIDINNYRDTFVNKVLPDANDKAKLYLWYDMLNIISLSKHNTLTIYNDENALPLTSIYIELRNYNLSMSRSENLLIGSQGKLSNYLNLFESEKRNIIGAKLIHMELIKVIFSMNPDATMKFLKNDFSICDKSDIFPTEILVEAVYYAAYASNGFRNAIKSFSASDPVEILKKLRLDDIKKIGETCAYKCLINSTMLSEFNEALNDYYKTRFKKHIVTILMGLKFSKLVKDRLKKEILDSFKDSVEDHMGDEKFSYAYKNYLTINSSDSEDRIKDKLDIRKMLYWVAFNRAPDYVLNYMIRNRLDDRELPDTTLAEMVCRRFSYVVKRDMENNSIIFMVDRARDMGYFDILYNNMGNSSLKAIFKSKMNKLEKCWNEKYFK